MTVKEYYDKHLANFYLWMIGDFDQKRANFYKQVEITFETTTGKTGVYLKRCVSL